MTAPATDTLPDAPPDATAPLAGESADPLRHLQKLAAMGTMAAMLAHEFNNLLTRAINHADNALRYGDDGELVQGSLQRILDNCTRAAEISRSIFDFAGQADERRRPIELAKLVREAVNCLGRDPASDNIALRCHVPPTITVQANGVLLQQVLYNLLLNARQAVLAKGGKRGGRITVAAEHAADGRVAIRVTDTGCGIAPENRERIFEAFFSTKRAEERTDRQGIGLGLAICRSIVAEHGGTLDVESEPGRGAVFILSLPGN